MNMRRLVSLLVESLVVLTLLIQGVVGSGSPVLAFPHHVPPSSAPAPVASGSRLAPDLRPSQPLVGAWYAPHQPVYGPQAAISSSPQGTQKRKPGEQPDLRTQTTETFLNPDGTWTLKAYGAPIHYKDAQGQWQPIDTTLTADSSDAGYAYGNRANDWRVHFAAQAGGSTLVHAQFPGASVAETLDAAAAAPAATNGSSVVYAGVFPGVNLQYSVGAVSLEETLLLQNAQAPTSYTFTYHLPGARASQDAAGNVVFTDAKGNVLLVIGGILMYESDAQGHLAPKGAVSDQVKLTLASKGSDVQITYTPDHAWLTDPLRHFPVAIDPTWQGGDAGQNTTSGNISADTYDASASSDADLNFWNVNSLRIGNCTASGLGSGTNRSYIKFPINPPPAGVRVTSADLALYQSSEFTGGTGVTVTAGVIPSAWNATTLTWNTRPTGATAIASGTTATTQNNWVHWNVTPAIYEWWQAGVALNGFELRYTDETKACQLFFSDNNTNSANRPKLTITYVQDTTAPGGGLSFNANTLSTNNATVTVAPAGSDTGSIQEWSSNWTSVNGVNSKGAAGASWSVDSSNTQLSANTSTCGSTQCWTQTYFTHTINVNNWPTFTAIFMTDAVNTFQFGAISGDNSSTRFMLTGSTTGFTGLQFSTTAGQYSTTSINVPISANTWYVGQVVFPLPTVGEIYIWPVGQARPKTPSVAYVGIVMTNPALNFFQYGDNAANLHHTWIGNVQMTSRDTNSGTTGYGIYGMQLSSDGTTYGCPPYSSTSFSFSGGPWCVYSGQGFSWTFPTGDGKKTLWWKYVDNAGNSTAGSSQVILDTAPPTVNSITLANGNPAQGSEVRGVVTLEVQATDPPASDGSASGVASAILYVDGVQAGTGVMGTSTPTFSLDTTTLSPGVHVLTAKDTDAAGNTGAIGGSTQIIVSNTTLMPYETLARSTLPDGQTDVSVNVANGDAVVTHQDLDVSGRGPDLALGRTYHALGLQSGLFGQGWTSDLDESLTINADGSRTYRDPNGGIHVFLPNGSGGFLTSPGLYLTLVQNADDTYTLTARDQSKTNFSVAGVLTSMLDRNGNTLTITYNGLVPATVTDAAGRQYSITITGGLVTQINAPGTRTYKYAYDGNGNLTNYTDPSGVVTHYDYDSSHRLTRIVLNYISGGAQDQQTNVVTTLTYDTNNRLVKLMDPLGYDTDMSYSIPAGGSAFQTQISQLQVVSSATYETTTYLLTTDGLGAVAKLTDALGNATQYQYDANENVMQVTDAAGHVVTTTYDSNGNKLTNVVDPGSGHLNLTTMWTYDSANNVLTQTDPRGIVTQYTYDSSTTGNVTQVIQNYASGGPINSDTNVTVSVTHDSLGETLTTTDPLGHVTKLTYDTYGNVLTTTTNYISGGPTDSQTNVTTSATYDVLGERLTATNALGVVTQYAYDILGHLLQTIANYRSGVPPDNQTNVTATYGYDALGRQVTVTNPRGIVTLTVYDADGRVLKTVADYVNGGATDVQTNVTTMIATYDAAGNTLMTTDAKGNTTTTVYDLDNRAVQVTAKDNATPTPNILSNSKTVYTVLGQVSESDTLDASGALLYKTTYTYDAAGRQLAQTDPPAIPGASGQAGNSDITTTFYDADGNTIEVKTTNAGLASPGVVSDATSTFDKLNRPLTKIEQANSTSAQTTSYVYDLAGRQISVTDPANKTTSATYDALGHVLTVTHPDTTVDTSTYDATGELLTKANSAGTTQDTYDPLGRIVYELRQDGTGAFLASKTTSYDVDGNKLTELTNFPGGTSTTYAWTYDKLDRQATMNDGTRTYTYDINGNVIQMVANGGSGTAVEADVVYDGANRVTNLVDKVTTSGTMLHSYSYQYDILGNRTQITEDGTTTTYSYSNARQLTQIKQGATTVASYTYDANNNRTSMVTSAGTTTYGYDTASDVLLLSKKDPNGKVTNYTYDSNGNLIKATYDPTGLNQITSYIYNSNNRLIEVDEPNGTKVQFSYDADGNRISKTVTSGSTTTVIKDVYALGRLAYQTDGAGNKLATFTYDTKGMPSSVVVGSGTTTPRYYYVYNAHGDVVALTDSLGNVVASYSYDAFGKLTASSENFPNGWSNPYRYDGVEGVRYDPETGLYWMSVRAYDPTLGRFISHDPLGRLAALGADLQPYVYAHNNPVNYTDPSGMRFTDGNGHTAIIPGKGQPPICFYHGRSGPCGGGSGNNPPGTPPPPPGPTQQEISDASNDAWWAAGQFGLIAGVLGLTVGKLGPIEGFLEDTAADLWSLAAGLWGSFWGAIAAIFVTAAAVLVTAAAVMVGVLQVSGAGVAGVATILAGLFTWKATRHTDDPSQWTYKSMEDFRSKVNGVIIGFMSVITIVLTVRARLSDIFTGKFIPFLKKTIPGFLPATAGLINLLGGFGEAAILLTLANNSITAMEYDLGY